MEEDKKYYWIRLDRNFFKRHDIRIIENMENGKEYVLFYMKLLLESIDHVGSLRFNELIPYNDSMLATITNTNIDIVRSAIKIFEHLDMLEILDDQTIYLTDTQKMLGEAKSSDRVKRFREKQKLLPTETVRNVTETLHETEIEKEIEIDKDIKPKKNSHFVPPSVQEVQAYCKERNNGIDAEAFIAHYESNGWMVGKVKMTKWKSAVITWEKQNKSRQCNPQQSSTQAKPNKFNQFPQRQYTAQDYSDLEKKLVNKGM